MKTIRIFISSPGDVTEERERARQVVQQLRRRYAGQLEIKAILWEEMPLQVAMSFQQGIDMVLSDDHGIDVAVIILWSRLGSPLGATILKADGGEYRSGTERELDLMLAAKKKGDGSKPALLVYTRQDEVSFEERLRGKSTEEKVEILEQKKLVEQYISEEFHDGGSGHNVRAYHSYDKPDTFSQRLRSHLQDLLDAETEVIESDPVWDIDKEGSPFLGLESFQPRHAPVFFGREDEILEVRQAIQRQAREGRAFVMIAGASGSGKSSLARAGVLPAIVENEIDDQVRGWKYLIFTPGELGTDPFTALAEKLTEILPELRGEGNWAQEFGKDLRESAPVTIRQAVLPALAKASAKSGGNLRLLLLVDQLEELISTSTWTAEVRHDFATVLEALAASGKIWILSTLRADFLGAVQQLPALVRLRSNGGQCDLLPPDVTELRRLITEPARLAELRFEARDGNSLADVILADAAGHAELLPLISHLLADLFSHRTEGNVMTFSRYEAVGGVSGALAKHADQTLASPAINESARNQLGNVLRLLVTVNGDDENTFVRQYPHLSDFSSEQRELVDAFIAARLFTTRPDGTVTLAHESLLRVWLPARSWVEANADFLRVRARVDSRLKQEGILLEEDPLFPAAMRHLEQTPDGFSKEQQDYLRHSKKTAEETQLRKARTRRLVMISLVTLTISSLITGVWAVLKQNEAVSQQKEILSKNQQLDASNQQNEQLLNSASMASLVNGLKAWQDDQSATANGERAETTDGRSKWHEAVANFVRALELNPENTRAADWLYSTLKLRWQEKRDWPVFTLAHDSGTTSAAYSPDGTKILTTDDNSMARIWEAKTGELLCGPLPQSSNTDERNFSADGTKFVTSAFAGTVSIRSTTTGEPVQPDINHGLPVSQASFSQDGKTLLTVDVQGSVKVWDTKTGQQIGAEMINGAPVLSAAFNHAGNKIACGGFDNLVRIWDVSSGSLLTTLTGHTGAIQSALFSPDDSKIITASYDKSAKVWDASNGSLLLDTIRHNLTVISACFSPDSKRILTASADTTARLWDADTGKPLCEPMKHPMLVRSARFNFDGGLAVTAANDGGIRLWDGTSGWSRGETHRHALEALTASFSPDGNSVVSSSKDQTVKIWYTGPATSPGVSVKLNHIQDVSQFTADGHTLAYVNDHGAAVIASSSKNPSEVLLGEKASKIQAVAITPDGNKAATVDAEQVVRIWDTIAIKELSSIKTNSAAIESLGINPAATLLFTLTAENELSLWNIQTGQRIGEPIKNLFALSTVCFSPKGKVLLTAGWDGAARLWDMETGKQIGDDFTCDGPVTHAAFNPDGTQVITSSMSKYAQVWDVKTGAKIGGPLQHNSPVSHGSFSPDGTKVATTCWDGVTQVWDPLTSKPLGAQMKHNSIVWCAEFSPDGTVLVTSGADKAARIWSLATNKIISEPFPHDAMVNSVRFSADGTKVLTVCTDKSATTWSLPDESTLEKIHVVTADIRQWANAVAGLKINDDGEIQMIPLKERQSIWKNANLPPGPWSDLADQIKATLR